VVLYYGTSKIYHGSRRLLIPRRIPGERHENSHGCKSLLVLVLLYYVGSKVDLLRCFEKKPYAVQIDLHRIVFYYSKFQRER
jgi:hypothetical protein